MVNTTDSQTSLSQIPGIDILDGDFLNRIVALIVLRDTDDELISILTKIKQVNFWDLSLITGSSTEIKTYKNLLKQATEFRLRGFPLASIKEKLKGNPRYKNIITTLENDGKFYDSGEIFEELKIKVKTFLLYKFLVDYNQQVMNKFTSGYSIDNDVFNEVLLKIERLYNEITFDCVSSETVYSDPKRIDKRFEERIERLQSDKKSYTISTGINLLDACFNDMGGFESGCVYMFGAPYGKGKTRFVTYLAAQAYLRGFNVTHISIENKKEQIEMMYDTALLGISPEDLFKTLRSSLSYDDAKKRVEEIKDELKLVCGKMNNILEIKKYNPYKVNPGMIESYLKRRMASNMPKPDMLIVDHFDIMMPNEGWIDNMFQRGELIAGQMKDLSERFNLVTLVPTQVGREGVKSNRSNKNGKTLGGEDTSRSMAKNELVDFYATLNQNDREAANGTMRIFIDKNRNGIDRSVIPVEFDKGIISVSPIVDPQKLMEFDNDVRSHVERLLNRLGQLNVDKQSSIVDATTNTIEIVDTFRDSMIHDVSKPKVIFNEAKNFLKMFSSDNTPDEYSFVVTDTEVGVESVNEIYTIDKSILLAFYEQVKTNQRHLTIMKTRLVDMHIGRLLNVVFENEGEKYEQ